MTRAIVVLQQEHKSLAKLLSLMESLLREIDDGQSPDMQLLREIGEYLSGYPDLCHHPKEDLIFRRLQKRDPAAVGFGVDLLREHQRLSELIDCYVTSLTEIGSGSGIPRKQFAGAMRELIDAYNHHMEMEEIHFFPVAINRLTEDDWTEINYAVSEQIDPLFDDATTKYSRLRDEIFRLAKNHDQIAITSARTADWFAQLTALVTPEQFNSLMLEREIQVELKKNTDGGYCLVERNKIIFEIPAINEEHAVWCAYGYVAARNY